ncbi:PREDICTED: uncharacterized protein LOC106741552 [Dinoponera quadriceps]|uniref:Uncharacterized protein LOC106741552 n=1 Tax=Dinoponera quadriceps TaxID=609295 RepID=A0A6P3WSS7_DINQU|nr:PREDICTED: uncharacterized protein LOC106741552 [Dinoponera quadriceps]
MTHYGDFLSMSGPMLQRYLLYYLTATAILVYGSSQRTVRRALCLSCGQDCPEALASPWYPRRELNQQTGILQDFSVSPYRNSPYFRLAQRDISRNIAGDHIFLSQNPISSRRYRSFSQQRPTGGYLRIDKGYPSTQFADKSEQQHQFLGNFSDKFTKFSGKQTTLSLAKPVNSYPFARVSPSGRSFGESERENSYFRNLRDKHLMSSSENLEVPREDKEDPAKKFGVVYRTDEKPSWKTFMEDSRHASSNKIVSDKFFPTFQTSILDKDEEEGKNSIARSPISSGQQHNNLVSPRDRYYSVGFGMPKIQRESYFLLEDSDVQKPAKDDEVYDNFMRDSLETSSLGEMKPSRNDFSEEYSAEEEEMVTLENGNEQIDYPYNSHQDLYIWRPTKEETVSPDNWNFATGNNLQDSIEIKQLKESESNWPRVYPAAEKDVGHFNDEAEGWGYFEDEFDKDTAKTGTSTYNSYTILPNTNIWRTHKKAKQDEALSDKLDFTFSGDLKGIKNTRQSEAHFVEENSNKHFRDENKYTVQDERRVGTDRIIRTPVINSLFTPYIFPQSPLNIVNVPKNPTPIESSITKDFSSGMKNNVQRANPTENIHSRFLKDGRVVVDDERNQDQIFVKDTYDVKGYSNPVLDSRSGQTKDNTQDEVLTKLDSDLTDEVEIPPAESTEPTPKESFERRSTPTTKKNS